MFEVAKYIRRLANREGGVSAVSYALLLGLIGVALISGMKGMGGEVNSILGKTSSALSGEEQAGVSEPIAPMQCVASDYTYQGVTFRFPLLEAGATNDQTVSQAVANGTLSASATRRCSAVGAVEHVNQTAAVNCDTDAIRVGSGGSATCQLVAIGQYSAGGAQIAALNCTNKPANSDYTSRGNGGNSCAWACSAGYEQSGNSCTRAMACGPLQLGYAPRSGLATNAVTLLAPASACRSWCSQLPGVVACNWIPSNLCIRYTSGSARIPSGQPGYRADCN